MKMNLLIQYEINGITTQIVQAIKSRNVIDDVGCSASMLMYVTLYQKQAQFCFNGEYMNRFNCTIDADSVNLTVVIFNNSDYHVLSQVKTYDAFQNSVGAVIPGDQAYPDFINKYIDTFDPDMADYNLYDFNVGASPLLYYLFLQFSKNGSITYEATFYDFTYVGCIDKMTLYVYK